jgi:hypothetical protein|tara:strand:+ start:983 stop:2305 length:1323 start_codon:yes stop_codon:yes gene_type:complete
MATYVNNLRLKEITTGDESGTWGTSTNTNLELIGEALGFGTEAITTNADTHTTTIADGSSDAGRAMFLKYTGTLDSACTITIGPNTMKRVHIIENATSGSQNIIISQGSGANITIPNGHAKAVYLDGAGSGAAVVDAFTDINIPSLIAGGLTFPTSDGSAGQFLKTDGSGTLSFATVDTTTKLDDIATGDAASTLATSAGNITIDAQGNDTDIIFKGTDNSSDITMLTLDGSEAGNATFNGSVTANAGVIVDNITIDGTEIDLSSGSLTLDVAGDIILDADGGDVSLRDGGTEFGRLSINGSSLQLFSPISNGDMIFKGNDGGSTITALTLDMSSAGAATFNNDVTAFSDKRLKTDISNIENGIEKVMQMQGVHYKRNDVEDAKPQIGVLAQDIEAIVPEIVLTADDEMQTKSVDYGKLTAVLIEAIKDLKAEIDELKGR